MRCRSSVPERTAQRQGAEARALWADVPTRLRRFARLLDQPAVLGGAKPLVVVDAKKLLGVHAGSPWGLGSSAPKDCRRTRISSRASPGSEVSPSRRPWPAG